MEVTERTKERIAQSVSDGRWYIVRKFADGTRELVASFPDRDTLAQWVMADDKYRAEQREPEVVFDGSDESLAAVFEDMVLNQDQDNAREEAHQALFKSLGGRWPEETGTRFWRPGDDDKRKFDA